MSGWADHERELVCALLEAREDEALWSVYGDLLMERKDRRADLIPWPKSSTPSENDPAMLKTTRQLRTMKRAAQDWFPGVAEVRPQLRVGPHGVWAQYSFGASKQRAWVRFQVDLMRGHFRQIWAELCDPESIPTPVVARVLLHLMRQPEAVLLQNLVINTMDSDRKGRPVKPSLRRASVDGSLWRLLFSAWGSREHGELPLIHLSLSDASGAVSEPPTELAGLWGCAPHLETLRLGLPAPQLGRALPPKLRSVSLIGSACLKRNLEDLSGAKLKHLAVQQEDGSYTPQALAPTLERPQPELQKVELSGFDDLEALMEALLASRLWPQLESLNLRAQRSRNAEAILMGYRGALSRLKRFVPPAGMVWEG